MNPNILFAFLFSLLISAISIAQSTIKGNYNFRNYTVNNGLPSSETYDVEQDNEGNIWIGTDRGLVKYDGRKFRTFTKKDGLIDNVILQIYKDYAGRLWFLTMKIELCYYENGKIIKYKYNNKIVKNLPVNHNTDRSIIVKNDNTVILSSRHYGIIVISEKGSVKKFVNEEEDRILVRKIDNELLWALESKPIPLKEQKNYKTTIQKLYVQENLTGQKTIIDTRKFLQGVRILTTGNTKNGFLLADNFIYNLKNKTKIAPHLNSNVINIQKIDNKLWMGTFLEGVQVYTIINGVPKYSKTILNNFSVSNIFKDKKGGYWFSTLEAGVFYLPFISIQNFNNKNGLISNDIFDVIGINNHIYLGFLNGNYQIITSNHTEKIIKKLPGYTNFGNLGNQVIISLPITGTYLNKKKITADRTTDFYALDKSTLLIGEPILRIYKNGKVDDISRSVFEKRKYFQAIMQDNVGQIWAGDINGIYRLKKTELIPFHPKEFSFRVTDLLYSKKWGKIITTRDGGVFLLKSDKFIKLNGILSDDVSCVVEDSKNNLWFGTRRGVNIVSRNKQGEINIDCITQNHGLISNEINSVFVDEKYAWIGTKKGLSKIDLLQFKTNNQESKIKLNSIILNNKKHLDLTKKISIPYNEDIVQINFNTINFITKGKFRYRFHSSSSWSILKDPELTLFNPEDGVYNLEVSFLNENNHWSNIQKISTFEITPPFWRQNYFKILLTLLIGFFIFLFIRYKKKQFETKQKVLILEQKALFAQMNPHFIFNTLNSIQSFLLYNENDKAEYFLSKFSKLLRETLHISRNSSVTLKKEIDLLEKYLELEQMRFSNKFVWEIIYNTPETEMNFRIPNMLIQPYIENSIKHGFTEKRIDFKIDIIFELMDENTLKCEVIDNGIGREASQLKKENDVNLKEHISYGEKITKERLKSYNKIRGNQYGTETHDILKEGIITGTKVEIFIPIIRKK